MTDQTTRPQMGDELREALASFVDDQKAPNLPGKRRLATAIRNREYCTIDSEVVLAFVLSRASTPTENEAGNLADVFDSKSWAWRMAAMLRFIRQDGSVPGWAKKIDELLAGPSPEEQVEFDAAISRVRSASVTDAPPRAYFDHVLAVLRGANLRLPLSMTGDDEADDLLLAIAQTKAWRDGRTTPPAHGEGELLCALSALEVAEIALANSIPIGQEKPPLPIIREAMDELRRALSHAPAGSVAQPDRNTGEADSDRIDWLQERTVDTIYMDDGRFIDVRGGDVRKAIDASRTTQTEKEA